MPFVVLKFGSILSGIQCEFLNAFLSIVLIILKEIYHNKKYRRKTNPYEY